MRMPWRRATLSSSASTLAPERPVSPKPAVITVTARTPAEAASLTTQELSGWRYRDDREIDRLGQR